MPKPKQDAIEVDGEVVELLPNALFLVRLDQGHIELSLLGVRGRQALRAIVLQAPLGSASYVKLLALSSQTEPGGGSA